MTSIVTRSSLPKPTDKIYPPHSKKEPEDVSKENDSPADLDCSLAFRIRSGDASDELCRMGRVYRRVPDGDGDSRVLGPGYVAGEQARVVGGGAMKMWTVGGCVVAGITAILWVAARMEREAQKQEQAFNDEILNHGRDAEGTFADYARRHPGQWPL